MNKIYTVSCDALSVFQNKKDAINYYNYCSNMSEGAERERYLSVLAGLHNNSIAKDGISNHCDSINIHAGDHRDKNLCYQIGNSSIKEAIDIYETKLQPILEVSANYGINLFSHIPFEEFGSDDDAYILFSFSDYYRDLLEKFNIEVSSIKTDDVSDGKYKIVINDKMILDVRAWDDFNAVIDNVDTIIEYSKKEELVK